LKELKNRDYEELIKTQGNVAILENLIFLMAKEAHKERNRSLFSTSFAFLFE
jgi:hypothetical protein